MAVPAPASAPAQGAEATARGKVPEAQALSRTRQVDFVFKLLQQKGEQSATQVRKHLRMGTSITVKNICFDTSVLYDALERWKATRQLPAAADAPSTTPSVASAPPTVPSTAAPPPTKPSTSAPPPTAPSTAAATAAASAASKAQGPSRGKRKAPVSNENSNPQTIGPSSGVDLQAVGAMGRAAKRKSIGTRPTVFPPRTKSEHSAAEASVEAPPSSGGASTKAPPSPAGIAAAVERSTKELKALLDASSVNRAGCLEKADLQALWERFELLRRQPLAELRVSCAASGGPRLGSADECARFLVAPQAPAAPAAATVSATSRERDAMQEMRRILPLRKESYPTLASWGFAVLGTAARDLTSVQHAYRALMRKLHPDRVDNSADAQRAVQALRDAKDICERSLARLEAPAAPWALRSSMLCTEPGHRRVRLQWQAPEERPSAPVRRYHVAAFDPTYGKALTITILEPDYDVALHRYVSLEELTCHVIAEEELDKMQQLWQQEIVTFQVAAANEAGLSPWATVRVRLMTEVTTAAALRRGRGRACMS
mmetsp:Transcript_122728/g.274085  ORF Transcript_122728/g.274085 Transcript_122728/m.274085 type:complete len:544 (+) Transcript_122728:115-1746(+)